TNGAGPGAVLFGHAARVGARSDENAIHFPSGDHAGRKSPAGCDVTLRDLCVARSRTQMSACPLRLDTNANVFPSGERAPWSANADPSVNGSRPEPSRETR